LQRISKAEMLWLFENGYLKLKDGKCSELTIANRQNSKKKRRYVPDYFAKIVSDKNIT
jgi:hypothetical protein